MTAMSRWTWRHAQFARPAEVARTFRRVDPLPVDGADAIEPAIAGLAIEKPLGHNLASSRAINDAVAAVFSEKQTFALDRYLCNETVQNLIALRFGNLPFEPLWNNGGVPTMSRSPCPSSSGSMAGPIV
jgi:hypothetical protein